MPSCSGPRRTGQLDGLVHPLHLVLVLLRLVLTTVQDGVRDNRNITLLADDALAHDTGLGVDAPLDGAQGLD